jgi:hypothetical protein
MTRLLVPGPLFRLIFATDASTTRQRVVALATQQRGWRDLATAAAAHARLMTTGSRRSRMTVVVVRVWSDNHGVRARITFDNDADSPRSVVVSSVDGACRALREILEEARQRWS